MSFWLLHKKNLKESGFFFFIVFFICVSYFIWADLSVTWEDSVYELWARNKVSLSSAFFYYFKVPDYLEFDFSGVHPNYPGVSVLWKIFTFEGFTIFLTVIFCFLSLLYFRAFKNFFFEYFLLSLPLLFRNGAEFLILWIFYLAWILLLENSKNKKEQSIKNYIMPLLSVFYLPLAGLFLSLQNRIKTKNMTVFLLLVFSVLFVFIFQYFLAVLVYQSDTSAWSIFNSLLFSYQNKDAVYKEITFFSSFYSHYSYHIFTAGFLIISIVFFFLNHSFSKKIFIKSLSLEFFLQNIFFRLLPSFFYLWISYAEMPVFLYLFMFSVIPQKNPPLKKRAVLLGAAVLALFLQFYFTKPEEVMKSNFTQIEKRKWIVSLQDMADFNINAANIDTVEIVDIKIIDYNINAAKNILKNSWTEIMIEENLLWTVLPDARFRLMEGLRPEILIIG